MGVFDGVIMIVISSILVANVLMPYFRNQTVLNTTSWNAGETAIWGIGGLVAVAGIVIGIARIFGMGNFN